MNNIKLNTSQTETLIELYRCHDCLWDSNNANYMDSDARQAALTRIAAAMGHGVTGGRSILNFY